MRAVVMAALAAACGGSEPAPARPAEPTRGPRSPVAADAGVAVDAFVLESMVGARFGARVDDGEASPTVSANLDKAIIRRVVRTRLKQITACYEAALAATAMLEGKVVVTFVILPSGAVGEASAAGLGDNVDHCVAAEFAQLVFPKVESGTSVNVEYPLVFKAQQ